MMNCDHVWMIQLAAAGDHFSAPWMLHLPWSERASPSPGPNSGSEPSPHHASDCTLQDTATQLQTC